MTQPIDYNGIALVIGAIGALVGSIVTAVLQLRTSRKLETNKNEAIAARDVQTEKIDHITHLVNNRSDQQDRKIDDLNSKLTQAKSDLADSQSGQGGQ